MSFIDLKNKTLSELKNIAKSNGIVGYSKYNSSNKDELIKQIKKVLKHKSSSPDCNMSKNECMKPPSRGGRAIGELQDFAENCGVEAGNKTKYELCDLLSKKSSPSSQIPDSPPSSSSSTASFQFKLINRVELINKGDVLKSNA